MGVTTTSNSEYLGIITRKGAKESASIIADREAKIYRLLDMWGGRLFSSPPDRVFVAKIMCSQAGTLEVPESRLGSDHHLQL